MNYGFRFREWNIYEDARALRARIDKIVRAFPQVEQYALTDQARRASLSVVLNIAESANKSTDKDMRMFLNRAHCSLDEVVACFDCALDQRYITLEQHRSVLDQASSLAKRLNGFTNHLSTVKSQQSRVKDKGFTLVELLVVVGILVALLAITLPFTRSFKFGRDVDAQANQLISVLREAQSRAMSQEGNNSYGVYFNVAGKSYTLYRGESYNSRDTNFNNASYGVTTLPADITVSLGMGTPQDILFSRLTGTLPGNTTITYTVSLTSQTGTSRTITIANQVFGGVPPTPGATLIY